MAAPQATRPLAVRLGWFLALWVGSVLGLGVIGFAIKLALR
ncbi:DUF2474 family protein [Roseococcus thiosulfatophilus]|nr:DUF2474 family protein [Roseococcus thiosulfatophilus]